MERFICIHGHFYQPPRENPWLEEVEQQDSAYPYHDWNERITAECYAPNASSRILDGEGRIIDIVNNYSNISFNFGPTLLSWIERHNPVVYNLILKADKDSMEKFSGHGSALAQVYNHMIMPLANSRDKRTQVFWGIRDFMHRFGRKPEGMWLAETAVDLETLDVMAEMGVKFTILAPHQAKNIRKIGTGDFQNVNGQKIDTKQPYLCRLPSGKSIAVFFYDAPISVEVSFKALLNNGGDFAERLLKAFSDSSAPQIVNIATDGETYGHHHKYGEMALTYALNYIESNNLAEITVYGEYLEKFPPLYEVEIHENTSWSCSHGIERWRNNCGCCAATQNGWNQNWRTPLREAMDWLCDKITPIYEKEISAIVHDPGKIRDNYIDLILDRSREKVEAYISHHAVKNISNEEKVKILKLLETQRSAMLMYTSCGWFFDDVSGIEAVQVMFYAASVIQTVKEISGVDLEPGYRDILKRAMSNELEFENGETVFDELVKPAVSDIMRAGAHYAVSSLFKQHNETETFFCYSANSETYELKEAGIQRLAIGKTCIQSHITWEEKNISFAILHLGDHNIIGGIRSFQSEAAFIAMRKEIDSAFMKSDIPGVISLIGKFFDKHDYSLWYIFRDEQRKILNQIIISTREEGESSFRSAYKRYYPIMQVMKNLSIPMPKAFHVTADFTINMELRSLLESDKTDLDRLKTLIDEAKRWSISVDKTTLSFVAAIKANSMFGKLYEKPEDMKLIETIHDLLEMFRSLSLELKLWQAQNIYFSIGKEIYPKMMTDANNGVEFAAIWIDLFNKLGQYLQIKSIQ